jgi:hypothetical protein
MEKRSTITSPNVGRFLWLLSVLLVPLVFGYAALFCVAPWIVRGFKPAKRPDILDTNFPIVGVDIPASRGFPNIAATVR